MHAVRHDGVESGDPGNIAISTIAALANVTDESGKIKWLRTGLRCECGACTARRVDGETEMREFSGGGCECNCLRI